MRIVAVTIARNEKLFIASAIESILKQTAPPQLYVVVDDDSTDGTAEIIKNYPVHYLKVGKPRLPLRPYNLVRGLRNGVNAATHMCPSWDFLVKLDADSVIPEDYLERLIARFGEDGRLGIASGVMRGRRVWRGRASDGAKIYRRDCWDDIGGLDNVIAWDTHAIVKAYQKGWKVSAFNDIEYVERRTSEREALFEWYLTGLTRYLLGFPLYHTIGVGAVYLRKKPIVIGSSVMILSQIIHTLKRSQRPFDEPYYNFAKRYAYREARVRIGVALKALLGGGLL